MNKRVNKFWRWIATGIGTVVFGVGICTLTLIFVLPVRLLPVAKSVKHRWLMASISHLCAFYVKAVEVMGLMVYTREGPKLSCFRGHLIVANHITLVDALFILAESPYICCIVKVELLTNPFTRYIVKLAGYIPNSSETLLSDAAEALAAGKNLLIFPEGTRNSYDEQLDFKRGAANIALSTGCPIVPVVLSIQPRTLQKGEKWRVIPDSVVKVDISSYRPLVSPDIVQADSPVTLQARQLTSALVAFYRQEIGVIKTRQLHPEQTIQVERQRAS